MAGERMRNPLTPEKVLRGGGLLSLISMGTAMIYRVSQQGYHAVDHGSELAESSSFFFVCACLFGLFYWEYVWCGRVLKQPLNVGLGKAQGWACVALLLFGGVVIWAHGRGIQQMVATDDVILTMMILGEALFVTNVCWVVAGSGGIPRSTGVPLRMETPAASKANAAVVQQAAVSTPAKVAMELPAKTAAEALESGAGQFAWAPKKQRLDWNEWLKPTTPMHQFGTVAIFLVVGGLPLQILMSSRFLVPWGGENQSVPMGVLWWFGAVPFAVFAGLYWFFGERHGLVYDKKLSNIHFGLTVFWLLDLVRLVVGWQTTLLSRMPALEFRDYVLEAGAIFTVCSVFFLLNLRGGHREEGK